MFRTLIAAVLALAGMLLLSGCATGTARADEAVEPVSVAQVVGRYSTVESQNLLTSTDAVYLATMRWLVPGSAFENSSDADLVTFAKNFCENGADASGLSEAKAVREMFGISSGELRSIFRVMIANYCPDLRGNA